MEPAADHLNHDVLGKIKGCLLELVRASDQGWSTVRGSGRWLRVLAAEMLYQKLDREIEHLTTAPRCSPTGDWSRVTVYRFPGGQFTVQRLEPERRGGREWHPEYTTSLEHCSMVCHALARRALDQLFRGELVEGHAEVRHGDRVVRVQVRDEPGWVVLMHGIRLAAGEDAVGRRYVDLPGRRCYRV